MQHLKVILLGIAAAVFLTSCEGKVYRFSTDPQIYRNQHGFSEINKIRYKSSAKFIYMGHVILSADINIKNDNDQPITIYPAEMKVNATHVKFPNAHAIMKTEVDSLVIDPHRKAIVRIGDSSHTGVNNFLDSIQTEKLIFGHVLIKMKGENGMIEKFELPEVVLRPKKALRREKKLGSQ